MDWVSENGSVDSEQIAKFACSHAICTQKNRWKRTDVKNLQPFDFTRPHENDGSLHIRVIITSPLATALDDQFGC